MNNCSCATPMTDEQLLERFDDSPSVQRSVPAEELPAQIPITNERLDKLCAHEERINSLVKHSNALSNTLMKSKNLEKQFPDVNQRIVEIARFIKSLGLP